MDTTAVNIAGINQSFNTIEQLIAELKKKTVTIPEWSELEKEYNPKKHPVFTDPNYKDKVTKNKTIKVTRIGIGLQKLAVKRMTQLMFGTPVKRIYKTEKGNKKQEEAARLIEKILIRNRINTINFKRGNLLFAGCEFVTLWYAQESKNSIYGVNADIKIRCKNYSPMQGDQLYPYFDDNGDLLALSFAYKRKIGSEETKYFETFTKDEHIKWKDTTSGWSEEIKEVNKLGKIPAVYLHRETPIWEDTSNDVYEVEWTLSRNGNYIRKNSKPIFGIFSDEDLGTKTGNDSDDVSVYRWPEKAKAEYITWEQATDSMKLQIENLYRAFFTELQIPDMSFDQMKAIPMSGEARKMMFVDAELKVTEEAGAWLEILDREVNVIKEFAKKILPSHAKEIDELEVEQEITPYRINDEGETIKNIMTATGGKQILSQIEGIKYLGWSDNPEQTMDEINKENTRDIFEPTT